MADREREERQRRARDKVRKLMAIYNRHPDTEEGRSAQAKALQLRQQYGLDAPTGDAFLDRLQRAADYNKFATDATKPPKPKFSRHAFNTMAGAFRQAFPGQDDEDYTKGHRVVDKEDDSD